MEIVTKLRPTPAAKIVRDLDLGRSVTVRGAGALKGRLTIEEGVDLVRPIAAQVLNERRRRGESSQTKR